MKRAIIVIGVLLFVGYIAGPTVSTAVVSVGPWEADVNKDGRVNSIDLLGVARQFGQVVPGATPTPAPVAFAFSAVSCTDEVVTGNLLVPSSYRASTINVVAFDGADTSSVAIARALSFASGLGAILRNYANTFPGSMPFSVPVGAGHTFSTRTTTSVFLVVQTWDGLFHEYTVVQCAFPPTPTPCPAGSTDIGGATSPPPANGHFCATFTSTATVTLTPTVTPSPTSTVTPGGPTNTPVTGGQDLTPPTLVAFDFTPKSVDTTNSSQTITFTAHITDNLSGVSFLYVQFKGPTTNQTLNVWFQTPHRISGTAQDGIYQSVATLPAYSEYGTWNMDYFQLQDNLGNGTYLSQSQFATLGFPATFTNGP